MDDRGDKLRLKRKGKGKEFADLTDHEEFIKANQMNTMAGEAHLPKLSHDGIVRPLLGRVSTTRLRRDPEKLTSFLYPLLWKRGRRSQSSRTLPSTPTYPLDFFTHPFPQPFLVARFEPKVRNFSLPLTIIGAH
ncbi:hypothetical protein E4U54_005649 [Claviceps lovelessii]|nr:hypothetical protein E4U54_005649 [Claviceps lovelessii]